MSENNLQQILLNLLTNLTAATRSGPQVIFSLIENVQQMENVIAQYESNKFNSADELSKQNPLIEFLEYFERNGIHAHDYNSIHLLINLITGISDEGLANWAIQLLE